MENSQVSEVAFTAEKNSESNSKGAALTLAALGVVYGDIGTSPLYTLQAIFHESTGVQVIPADILGAVSTIVWALFCVVTLKYVLFILRINNHGEGGVLALSALASSATTSTKTARIFMLLGVVGAALFYGDSLITPAISVLGAVEGVGVVAPTLHDWILPISIFILLLLFAIQRFGTGRVGKAFGPLMVIWFLTLAISGVFQIFKNPSVLQALNPFLAVEFLSTRHWMFLLVVGGVVLALTGAEALYADMGHFGRTAIQRAWLFCVFPSLILNYLGQGGLLLQTPSAIENPFFNLFPVSFIWGALLLATLAAVIASQAVIAGAFSVTRQAIQMGFFPRMQVLHKSWSEQGQIYIPVVNRLLLLGVVATVLLFQSSAALANAYGTAVTLTMLITSILGLSVYHLKHNHLPLFTRMLMFILICMDVVLVASCMSKFLDGGWLTVLFGVFICLLMFTWYAGRMSLLENINREGLKLSDFINVLNLAEFKRADRTAVYLVANPDLLPQALLHNLKHNQVLHRENIVATVYFENIPWVTSDNKITQQSLGKGFWKLGIHVGFMERPDIPQLLSKLSFSQPINMFNVSYFLSRETLGVKSGEFRNKLRNYLFIYMMRNAGSFAEYFQLPDNQVVELGTRVQI